MAESLPRKTSSDGLADTSVIVNVSRVSRATSSFVIGKVGKGWEVFENAANNTFAFSVNPDTSTVDGC